MAVLQKIRNKAGIFVIIFVGVALFLFIVDPTTFQMLFQGQNTTIAKINKKKVDYNDYQEYYNYNYNYWTARQGTTSLNADEERMLRDETWSNILDEYLYAPCRESVGINVSEEELEDALFGSNIHPVILQSFSSPETGVLDTAGVKNFFANAEYDARTYVITEYFKKFIKLNKAEAKYSNMIAKGFYMPIAFAEMDYNEKNTSVDFEYVQKKYADISDENVQISDADLKKYYDENKFRFLADKETRELTYVTFNIIPSSEDTLSTYNEISGLYDEFGELTAGKMAFAARYNDNERKTLNTFILENELPNGLPEGFFEEEVGTKSNIILDNNAFFFSEIVETAERPDSVQLSQIVFLINDTVPFESCKAKADSIKLLAKNGEEFAFLALLNSDDNETKIKGGDIGWFTEQTLTNINIADSVFPANTGDVFSFEYAEGIFLIKVTNQTEKHRKVKLATINKMIRPSLETETKYYGEANSFIANNNTSEAFDNAITEKGLAKRIATVAPLDERVNNLENARLLVKWAYEKDVVEGTVSSTIYEFPGVYVVAKLSDITSKGVKPFEKVKTEIEPIVIKDKKAETLMAELKGASSNLSEYASSKGATYNTANSFNFGSFSVPGVGIEPNINGTISVIEQDKVSEPIKGNSGVFVVKVTNKTPAAEKTDYSAEQLNSMRISAGQIYRLNEALEKRANVEDLRFRFF